MRGFTLLATEPVAGGYVDPRRNYRMNVLVGLRVVDFEALNRQVTGGGFAPSHIDVLIEDVHVTGISDPKFHGFFDPFPFDTDNSLFDAINTFISLGTSTIRDVRIENAELGVGQSGFRHAVLERAEIIRSVIGVDFSGNVLFDPALESTLEVRHSEIRDNVAQAIGCFGVTEAAIERNEISGTFNNGVHCFRARRSRIVDNQIRGSFVHAIWDRSGSDNVITRNEVKGTLVGFHGAIELGAASMHATFSRNQVKVTAPEGAGIADFNGTANTILDNDVRGSGRAAIAFLGARRDLTAGNQVATFMSTDASYWLDEASSENVVYVGDERATVLDLGSTNTVIEGTPRRR